MRNKFAFAFVVVALMALVLGCGRLNPLSGDTGSSGDKTTTDRAVDTVVGEERIGIPECDAVMDFFDREMNSPDDNAISKAIKATVLNTMKENFRKSIEENKTDRAELAKTCAEFKKNLDKYKAEEDAKK